MAYTDEELLQIVGDERKRSIGFGEGDSGELTEARETALSFYKGDMLNVSAEHRMPSLPNRSKAVDTTVADAIETVLPDVLEIFVGGDDVATFIPQGEQDEQAAKDESDFITHVVMVENDGFLNLYTACKDALLVRTGVLHWWWEENSKAEVQLQLSQAQAPMAPMVQAIAGQGGQDLDADEQDDGSVNLTQTKLYGKVCIKAFPPEDFTVARDTVNLKDTTYCAVRDRPRVQDLIARGVDAEVARALPSYVRRNDTIELARDEAGEHDQQADSALHDLRVVETRAHYVRLAGDDGQLTVWRIVTDGEERTLIEKEEVGQIPFAALTPYLNPHRFYGESVSDKLIEVQKIKTALLRMHLDSGYFAINQRHEVADGGSNEHTIADLLRNEPGVPVRVKTTGTVVPIAAGQLDFDTLASLEYAATMAESRSGIVRNAQGINPDTLHDTASGALALMSMAQRRVRMIARIFAETGIKDLFLGVHAMLRASYTQEHAPATAKIGNKWQTMQPNEWPEREAMTVHVGVGSAGKEHDLAIAAQRLQYVQEVITLQGGLSGPLVTAGDAFNALSDWESAAGSKKADQFWTDPTQLGAPQPQPKPDPEMAKAQQQMQLQQQTAQANAQLEQQKAATKAQSDEAAATRDFQLQQQRIEGELALKREQNTQQMQLEREKAGQTLQLQREEMLATVALKREELRMKASTSTDVDSAVEALPG